MAFDPWRLQVQEALDAALLQQEQAHSTTTQQLARPESSSAGATSPRALTMSVPTGTFTIKFICTHCIEESVNVGVKPSPLPQVGLKCSLCDGLNGSGSYTQFEELKIVNAPKRADDWDAAGEKEVKAFQGGQNGSDSDTEFEEFEITEAPERAASLDEADSEVEGSSGSGTQCGESDIIEAPEPAADAQEVGMENEGTLALGS